jgi:hypothetical protein
MVTFVDPMGIYEVSLPSTWPIWPNAMNHAGVSRFGHGAGANTDDLPALTISVGDAEGNIALCAPVETWPESETIGCDDFRATNLDQLGEVLVSSPWPLSTEEWVNDTELGGEVGRVEQPLMSGRCLGCRAKAHFYAFRGGRPIVLAFDWWIIRFDDSGRYLREIVESFRFRDQ